MVPRHPDLRCGDCGPLDLLPRSSYHNVLLGMGVMDKPRPEQAITVLLRISGGAESSIVCELLRDGQLLREDRQRHAWSQLHQRRPLHLGLRKLQICGLHADMPDARLRSIVPAASAVPRVAVRHHLRHPAQRCHRRDLHAGGPSAAWRGVRVVRVRGVLVPGGVCVGDDDRGEAVRAPGRARQRHRRHKVSRHSQVRRVHILHAVGAVPAGVGDLPAGSGLDRRQRHRGRALPLRHHRQVMLRLGPRSLPQDVRRGAVPAAGEAWTRRGGVRARREGHAVIE
mmetsp:Transcript_10417/g.21502  ORF Transcript_10417/g.21502 Transcript_10417/m.21502 type:complete len:283 (-) Transcript_10417:2-850(-)